jgi:predicted Zn-dependent peptidase
MIPIYQHRLNNGLWLVAEPVAGAQSLAMAFLLPAGVAHEPVGQQGVAALLAEMVCRGAGGRDARAHSDALDRLGVQRATQAQTTHVVLSATMIHSKLPQALPLLVDMALHPALEERALGPSRDLALQSLDALEDEPQQKVFYELRQRHYPQPFGRSPLGRREHLESIEIGQLREYWRSRFVPEGAVLGFAGRFDWEALKDQVQGLLGPWEGGVAEPMELDSAPRGYQHLEAQSTQVHIGLAYDSVPEPHPDSMLQRVGIAALSGGMSGRLFTEVREKRGLCYSVYATYAGQKHRGAVLGYAGTTAGRAQETLDVFTAELRRLSQGVDESELTRAAIGMKSDLVMQGESTGARAHAIATDQYVYGRPRTLQELTARIDSVTLEAVNRFLRDAPAGAMTIVTIGPKQLQVAS